MVRARRAFPTRDPGAFFAPFCVGRLRSNRAHPSLAHRYLAQSPVSSPGLRSQTTNSVCTTTGARPRAAAVNLWAREAQDGRPAIGMPAHHRGYFFSVAPAAPATRFRLPGLAQPLRLLTPVPVSLPLVLMQMLLLVGTETEAVMAAAALAALAETVARSKIFARLRRAIFRAPAARVSDVPRPSGRWPWRPMRAM